MASSGTKFKQFGKLRRRGHNWEWCKMLGHMGNITREFACDEIGPNGGTIKLIMRVIFINGHLIMKLISII